jgi:hypothetical protein
MPVLRRLVWPWLLLPAGAATGILGAGVAFGGIRPLHVWLSLLAVGFFGAVFASLIGLYRQWSVPGPAVEGALVPQEPAVLVSRGGFLTPGSGTFTREKVLLFSAGRLLVTLPLERVGRVVHLKGRLLRTPYVELFALDGHSLGRWGVESAEQWARALSALLPAKPSPQ